MNKSTGKKLTGFFGLAIAYAAVSGISGASMGMGVAQAAPDAPSLTVGYFKSANPETVGQTYNLFPSNIHFSTIESGITAFQEMIAGSMQIAGGVGVPPVALAQLRSMPIKVIDVEYTFRQDLVVSAAIKQPQDLVGKTIAVTAGTTGDESFTSYLTKHNIDPKSVKIINMDGTAMLGAFHRGDIAGGYIWDPVRSRLFADGGHSLDTSNALALIVASDSAIQQNPQAIQAYVCSIANANKFILTHHDETLKVLTALLKGDQATAEQVYAARRYLSPKDAVAKWMGNDAANLAGSISDMTGWANNKSTSPVTPLPDPHLIIDTQFAVAAANGACK